MATGAGKTTVMAMLIAWQTVNAVRLAVEWAVRQRRFSSSPPASPSATGCESCCPRIPKLLRDARTRSRRDAWRYRESKIVITNYHAFKRRETMEVSKVGRALLARSRRIARDDRDRRPHAPARAWSDLMDQQYRRHQRRSASLLSGAAERKRKGSQGRGKGRGEEKQRGRTALDFRH